MEKFNYEQVSVIPVREAGGAMTAYAYNHFDEAVVVEDIEADAGIDIGDTLIGMHLRKVAVPVRLTQNTVGSARIIGARSEEHTSELQSRGHLVCRLLLEKKK